MAVHVVSTAGGGPVGSGVIPVDVGAQVLTSFAEGTVRQVRCAQITAQLDV